MLEILKNRFQGNMNLHPELQWADVENLCVKSQTSWKFCGRWKKAAVSRIPLVLIKKQGN